MKLTPQLLETFKHYKTSLKVDGILFVQPSNLLHKCNKCGDCCRVDHPTIALEEIEEIKKFGFDGFYEENKERPTGWMMKRVNEKCFFLGEDNLCKIYANRPLACRMYPYKFVVCQFGKTQRLGALQEIEGLKDGEESICGGWKKEFVTKEALKDVARELKYCLERLHLLVGKEKADELRSFCW